MKKTIDVRKYRSAGGAVKGVRAGVGATLFEGDCFELISELPAASVDLVITSPPYCMGTRCIMVMADGFAWNGRTYDSLSKVAFAITGTKWNGPRFFGLRDKADRLDEGARS
jgi:DNA modification methylase